MNKRYAIVRVDDKKEGKLCPLFENEKLCNIEKNCWNCKIKYQYGDTKEQLIRKVAQVIFRRKLKLYKKIWGSDMGSIERKDIYEQCLDCAKEIVEFLGIRG